jgi:hypothetical protein
MSSKIFRRSGAPEPATGLGSTALRLASCGTVLVTSLIEQVCAPRLLFRLWKTKITYFTLNPLNNYKILLLTLRYYKIKEAKVYFIIIIQEFSTKYKKSKFPYRAR